MKPLSFLWLVLFTTAVFAQPQIVYESSTLVIEKLSDRVYTHISFLETRDFGKVPCNGLIAFDNHEAIVMETPVNNEVSVELINWIEDVLKGEIMGVIAHHFHKDCLGGLEVFHDRKIPSFGKLETIKLAVEKGYAPPQQAIEESLEFRLGNQKLISSYFGPAHTTDNIVTYFPAERALFGGCMIKSLNAGKGNLEDADIRSWSATVRSIKNHYPDVKLVVPGHGNEGGLELLDYTIRMFEEK